MSLLIENGELIIDNYYAWIWCNSYVLFRKVSRGSRKLRRKKEGGKGAKQISQMGTNLHANRGNLSESPYL